MPTFCAKHLETDSGIDNEAPRPGSRCDAAERVDAVDVCVRRSEIRMIQHVDGIHTEFEPPALIDVKSLDQIQIEAEAPWSLERRKA